MLKEEPLKVVFDFGSSVSRVQKASCGPLSSLKAVAPGGMNRTHPQRNGDVATFDSAKSFSEEQGCCRPRCAHLCCPPRQACIVLLFLAAVVAIVGLAIALGLQPRALVDRFCVASHNWTGFLCDDRLTCIQASQVCDRTANCRNGEDEQEKLCGDLPRSLPEYLVFHCSNPEYWVYADQRCNGMNDCGDCSDEMGSLAACPPCGPSWWTCSPVHYEYCSCVPRALCQDRVQHCVSWSDEYLCRP